MDFTHCSFFISSSGDENPLVTIAVQQPPKPKAKKFVEPTPEAVEVDAESKIEQMLKGESKKSESTPALKEIHSRWVDQNATKQSSNPFAHVKVECNLTHIVLVCFMM